MDAPRSETPLDAGLEATPAMLRRSPPVERGALLGRYLVLDVLGSGGMGVVYAAFDPELDRKVAIKLLRGPAADGPARARLVREAQAMARLSHTNVIHVYDVGTLDDEVFIAMELIEGPTLRRWLAEARRTEVEIVAAFVQAGRGLAAAHGAGLVHRDFKPDNVLVGRDGRVVVVDFGIARILEDSGDDSVAGSSDHDAALTRPGARIGTPAYMSPEQIDGADVDERSDQYSFCVALHEALCGERPPRAPATVTDHPEVATASRPRNVPARVWPVIERGLARAPADRFASMTVLLATLSPDREGRRTHAYAIALAVAVTAVGGVTYALRDGGADGPSCDGGEAKLAQAWGPSQRAALRDAFQRSGGAFAGAATAATERALDRYTASWSAMHREACEATRAGAQSEDLLDLRMECLEQRIREARALTELFARADAALVARASQAAESLTPIDPCGNAQALRAPIRPPSDPATTARVTAVRTDLAQLVALELAGQLQPAFERARDLVPTTRALAYAPLEGEVQLVLGRLFASARGDLHGAVDNLTSAAIAFLRGRDLRGGAEAWIALVTVYARAGRVDEARMWGRYAQAAVETAGGEPRLGAHLLGQLGNVELKAGRLDEALALHERARTRLELAFGRDDAGLVAPLVNLGVVYVEQDRTAEAIRVLERAIAIGETALGPDHVAVARALVNLGNALDVSGATVRAVPMYERALAILVRALPAEHPEIANCLHNFAQALHFLGRHDEARDLIARALAMDERLLGPDHPDVAIHHTLLADVLEAQGRRPDAMAHYERGLAIQERVLPAEHPALAPTLRSLARLYMASGNARRAVPLLERALAIAAQSPSIAPAIRAELERARAAP